MFDYEMSLFTIGPVNIKTWNSPTYFPKTTLWHWRIEEDKEMLRRDISMGLIAAAAGSTLVKEARAQSCTAPCFAQTAAELAAGITPVNTAYLPGNVLRYGTNIIPNTTDMTMAKQNALKQAGQTGGVSAYLPGGTYLVKSQLTMYSDSHFYGDGSSSIINFNSGANADSIAGVTVSNCVVQDIKLAMTAQQSGGSYVGAAAFRTGSSNCVVERCEITGVTSCGVVIDGSQHCRVAHNYFHDFMYGTGGNDSADIHVYCDPSNACSYNVVEGNQCFGGNNHGIAVETSATPDTLMVKNIIIGNRVGAHTAYGITLYSHQTGDTYNEVIGNYVENISGSSSAQGGSAGAGIYVAGMGAVTIANNVITNCCTATSNIRSPQAHRH